MPYTFLIGATGTVGRHVTSQLVATGTKVRALVRHPEKAHLPPEIEIAQGDLTIPESLNHPLDDVDSVFLTWTAPPQFVAPVIESIAKKAKRVVFLSAPIKTPHPFFQQPNPVRQLTAKIEQTIAASGIEHTFLRPAIFAANALNWWAPQIRAGNKVRWPYLSVPTAPTDERDIATIAAHALRDQEHANADYVITGPQPLTQHQQISAIASAINRPLQVQEMTPEEARQEWSATWPPAAIDMLLSAWKAAEGQPAFVSNTFEELTGSPPRTFAAWARDNATSFQR